jgi:hypothetical protein
VASPGLHRGHRSVLEDNVLGGIRNYVLYLINLHE